jgi:Fe-S oxidoreductase
MGHSFRDLAVAYLPKYAPMISSIPFLPAILNLRNHIKPIAKLQEWLMGISAQRSLPIWKGNTFWNDSKAISSYQFTPEQLSSGSEKGVVLLADTFNAYFENENLTAALQVLKAAGYRVHIPQKNKSVNQKSVANTCSKEFCCGRTYLAAGMVDKAKETLGELVDHLAPYAQKKYPHHWFRALMPIYTQR